MARNGTVMVAYIVAFDQARCRLLSTFTFVFLPCFRRCGLLPELRRSVVRERYFRYHVRCGEHRQQRERVGLQYSGT